MNKFLPPVKLSICQNRPHVGPMHFDILVSQLLGLKQTLKFHIPLCNKDSALTLMLELCHCLYRTGTQLYIFVCRLKVFDR